MKMLTTSEDEEPLKWRFYHASHMPDVDVGFLDLDGGTTNEISQVEESLLGGQVNGDLGTMHHSGLLDYDFSPGRASPRGPVKAMHDFSMAFPDTDSGFGSYKSRGRVMEDFAPPIMTRVPRSRSLTRLNGLTTQEMSEVLGDKTARNVQTQLEDSEARRCVLMAKLKEAQATLELQNDRLSKIENSAKDNTALVEDLKFKEREYRKKIAQLQAAEEEKQMLQMENGRLREEMQERIDMLDFQLKTLKNQHQSTEHENSQRLGLLDQTTTALSLLEQENAKLQMDREKLREEIGLMKEALQLSKSRFDSLEGDHKTHAVETDRLREENLSANKRMHEMAGQMMELRSLLQAVKDDNERLSTSWQSASQNKDRVSKQIEGYQDSIADLKSRLAAAMADKDRYFQEKMDMNYKVQQLILEKEQLLKSRMVLDEQIEDQQKVLSQTKNSTSRHDEEKKHLQEELSAVKRVSQDLSTELASVKAFYERALEQLSLAENSKKVQEDQVQLGDQERRRLQGEVDRLSKMLDSRNRDDREERQHLEDTILRMRSEMKDEKFDKEQLSKKVHELEAKLQKANDEIRGGFGKQHTDLETWKTTCDRLTTSVTRKETELQALTDKCHNLEKQLATSQGELRHAKEKQEDSSDMKEEIQRLQDENRRLLQEKAENEQMLQLLETQRDVLTKSTESGLTKLQDVEQLSGKVDQMRSENELLRQRISELEKVRDNLIKQKEELLANSELIYKTQGLDELEGKMEELREANKQLRDINEVMSTKLQMVEQENLRLKHAVSNGSSKDEVKRLREENKHLLDESNKLRSESRELVSQTSKETDVSTKEMQNVRKERDALQKQVQLINGQLNLLEGSKKRAEDTAQRSQSEISQLRSQLESTRKEYNEARRVASQVKTLSEELQKAKQQQESQEKLIRSMKEELEEERSKKPAQIQESLEDVGAELQQMSGELHKLMAEIQRKEQTIESLEKELRISKDTCDTKEHTVGDLKKLVSDLEQQNCTLKATLDGKPTNAFGDERPSLIMRAGGERSLKDELEEAVKSKHSDCSNDKPRTVVRSKSMIPIKLRGAYPVRLTIKDDKPATEKAQPADIRGKLTGSSRLASSAPPSQRTAPATSTATPKPPVPKLVLSPPSPSSASDTSMSSIEADFQSLLSHVSGPTVSAQSKPTQPSSVKKSSFGREATSSSQESGQVKKSMSETRKTDEKSARPALTSLFKKGEEVSPAKSQGESGAKSETKDEDTTDFPPLTPPPVEQTKQKLAFAKPQPASRGKPRKLPQIRPTEESPATEEGKRQLGAQRGELGKASTLRLDSFRQKSKTSPAAKTLPASPKAAARAKTSPRESLGTFMSRRELTGQPSKLLSDSGVTVIATKTGSSQRASSDVKYVVKKQDTSSMQQKTQDSSGTSQSQSQSQASSFLKSFDDLLSKKISDSSGAYSLSTSASENTSGKVQMTPPQPAPRSKVKSEALTAQEDASKPRPKSPTKFPARTPFTSKPSSEQTSSTQDSSSVKAKSSSVKDFLASFSGKTDQDKGTVSSSGKEEEKPSAKPLFSRITGSSSPLPESHVKKSSSFDSFASLLGEEGTGGNVGPKQKKSDVKPLFSRISSTKGTSATVQEFQEKKSSSLGSFASLLGEKETGSKVQAEKEKSGVKPLFSRLSGDKGSSSTSAQQDSQVKKSSSFESFSSLLGGKNAGSKDGHKEDKPVKPLFSRISSSKSSAAAPKDSQVQKSSSFGSFTSLLGEKSADSTDGKKEEKPTVKPLFSRFSSAKGTSSTAQQDSQVKKSSSFDSFSALLSDKGSGSKDRNREEKSTVKPLFSRISSSVGSSTASRDTSVKKSASFDSFASLLDEPTRTASTVGTKASEGTLSASSTLGSSLGSSARWTYTSGSLGGSKLDFKGTGPVAKSTGPELGKAAGPSATASAGAGVSKTAGPSRKIERSEKAEAIATKSATSTISKSLSSVIMESMEEGQPLKFRPATGMFLSKSLGHPISSVTQQEGAGAGDSGNKSVRHGRYGSMFFNTPDKQGTEEGDRLQSLISKYRSHSTDPPSGTSSPVGGAKERISSAPPSARGGLSSTKGRGFVPGAPKAPLLRPDREKSADAPPTKTGKKLPPPPPPKPSKSLMKSLSAEDGARAEGAGGTSEMLDSQEQSDINALIQKPGRGGASSKSMISVHPPKLTSKVPQSS